MPPKAAAKEAESKTVLLGRPGTSLKLGVVGLPNVGKSTFFNVLSHKNIPAENRPFCTIDPNTADINIPDARFDKLCRIYNPASRVQAQLHIRDIAGLVRGASTGEGLGNAFLSHIAECDGILHMCRLFDEEEIIHVEGDVDPVRDIDIIFKELVIKDLATVNALIEKTIPIVNRGLDKSKKVDLEYLQKIKLHLEAGKQVRCGQWNNKEVEFLNTLLLLTSKPAVFLANLSEKDYVRQRNKWLPKLKAWVDEQTGEPLIPFSCSLELALAQMPTDEAREEHLKSLGPGVKSQIMKIVTTGFQAINLIYFFTAGEDEVKAWTIQRGYKAPQAAGRIHTDFEKGFICADVIHWKDFDELEDESKCRDEGKLQQQGKTYEVQDGDIIHFKFNVSKGGK